MDRYDPYTDKFIRDTIYRQAAIEAFYCADELIVSGEANARNVVNYINKVVGKIENLPSAQPMRKRGKWISADAIFGGVPFYCSECGENTRDTVMGKPRWNYCHNCGADMRGEENETD